MPALSIRHIALTFPNRYDSTEMNALCMARIGELSHALETRGFAVARIPRDDMPQSLDDFDLVVAAGGDGTQLDAATRIHADTPLCPVRLFPERSVGYLCRMDYSDFDTFAELLRTPDRLKIDTLPRLACTINGEMLPTPVVNDILVAHECPARASRYRITYGDRTQLQCSSGIWIATNAGSHAAAKAAGAAPLPPDDSDGCVFAVRELSQWPDDENPLKSSRFLPQRDILRIEAISSNLHIYTDGALAQYPVHKHQKIGFLPYPTPLIRVFC